MKNTPIVSGRSIILALVPLIGIYIAVPGITYDILLLLIFVLLNIFSIKNLNKNLIIYFLIIVSVNFFSYIFNSDRSYKIFANNTLYIIIFAITICLTTSSKINDKFTKTLLILGVVSTVFLFYQYILFNLFNVSVTSTLPLDIIDRDRNTFSEIASITRGRPNSFFLEPAHYSIFILPILNYCLSQSKYVLAVLFLLGLFISSSSTGIVIGVIIVCYYFIYNKKKLKKIAIFAFAALLPLIFFNDLLFESILNNITRVGEVSSLNDNIRLFSNLHVINKMNFFDLIFGLGHNQLESFMIQNGMTNAYNYSNSFLMSIFSFGIIGFICLIVLLCKLFKENPDKGYLIILVLILLTDQILFNRNFLYLVSCIYFLNQNKHIITNKAR